MTSRILALPALLNLVAAAQASPLLVLWSHEASHCVQGVAPELCELARISETRKAATARERLDALAERFASDRIQGPAYRTLRYLATEQARMEANGSGSTSSPDDPDGAALEALRAAALDEFDKARMEELPYIPAPLLKVMGSLAHRDPERHRALTERVVVATLAMRRPLDREAASLLALLGSHQGSYDPVGAVELLTRARQALPEGQASHALRAALLLREASVRGRDASWDSFPRQDFGADHVVQALVLIHRAPDMSRGDFQDLIREAQGWLSLKRTWVKKSGRWNPEIQAQAWQADALLDLLRRERPKDFPQAR